jgi:ribosomal subunit interface protein
MQLPLQLSFHELPHSDAIELHVRKRAAKLDRLFDRITSCRVAVEIPHRRHLHGKRYRVRIDLTLPGHEIAISRDPPADAKLEDMHAAIDGAFDEAERRIEDCADKLRGKVKRTAGSERGRVAKLFRESGYGFIESHDGVEIYFHENSVLHGRFGKLEIGDEVRYAVEDGEKGPQASTVDVRPHRARTARATRQRGAVAR